MREMPARGQRRRQLREARVDDLEARIVDARQAFVRRGDRVGILVEREHACARAEARKQRARVAAAAEGAVDVDAVRARHERVDGFVEQDGGVRPGMFHGGTQKMRLSSAAAAVDCMTASSWAA